jgi:hydrogenase expression/formation protein HypE
MRELVLLIISIEIKHSLMVEGNSMVEKKDDFSCPIPLTQYPHILLAHGSGGKLMHQLLEKIFLPTFSNPLLNTAHDGAVIDLSATKLAFSTDSYVVHPLFFPGGDIGSLAVYGTINDLAMCGAKPRYLSASFILEEGLPLSTLWRIVQSMQMAANRVGVQIITGDTKVVDRGKADGLFINTTGIGTVEHTFTIAPQAINLGDDILLSGDIGRHGMAIMAVREGLEFESEIESDLAPLSPIVEKLLAANIRLHCLRDLTRGGLATSLNELAGSAQVGINIYEPSIPVREDVAAACEILGLDPLYVACEGRFIAFVPPEDTEHALHILKQHQVDVTTPAIIGNVAMESGVRITMENSIGTHRILDMLSGDQLPRIC